MPTPTVFISYSHVDRAWKDRLLTHLRISEKEGALELWDDRRIAAGTEWRAEIEKAIDAAAIGILLISADFLVSDFIRGEEIPRMLERRSKNGMRLFPVMVRSCDWQIVTWLAPIQIRPTGARPLADFRGDRRDSEMAAIARELRAILGDFNGPEEDLKILPPDKYQGRFSSHEIGRTRPGEPDDVPRQIVLTRRSPNLWFVTAVVALSFLIALIAIWARPWSLPKTDWHDVENTVRPTVVRIRCLYRLRIPMRETANSKGEISTKEVLLQEAGSGVLIRSDLVLTAKSVVEPWKANFRDWVELQTTGWKSEYDELDIQLDRQPPIKATLVASADDFDLALLRIQQTATQQVPIVFSSRAVSVNDRVAIISYPINFGENPSEVKDNKIFDPTRKLSHIADMTPTFMSSHITRSLNASSGPSFLTFDSDITNGRSGGAMVNNKGELIGIVSQQFKPSRPIVVQGQTIEMNEPVSPDNTAVSPNDIRAFLRSYGVL